MKTPGIAVGMVLFCLSIQAVWAQETESTSEKMSIAEYINIAKDFGYNATLDRKSEDHAVILLEKHGETEEGHGLLNLPWEMRETWKLEFYRSQDTLKLFSKNGNAEKKAPWLGEWREYEPKTRALTLPMKLQVPWLKAAFYMGLPK